MDSVRGAIESNRLEVEQMGDSSSEPTDLDRFRELFDRVGLKYTQEGSFCWECLEVGEVTFYFDGWTKKFERVKPYHVCQSLALSAIGWRKNPSDDYYRSRLIKDVDLLLEQRAEHERTTTR